ncbi:MAG: hypothetical protein IPM59_13890 [Chloracidobacterium sp.]|nr:hypothetical protein [Chloracidobacterium sp.]
MISVEELKREIDLVPADKLDGLYRYVRGLARVKPAKQSRQKTIERLNSIRIDAPADLATNLDEYLYFGKEMEK